MKSIKLKNYNSAKAKNMHANWEFVNDKKMSPYGIDWMEIHQKDEAELSFLEDDNTVTVNAVIRKKFRYV